MNIVTWDIEIAREIEELPRGWDDARVGLAGISSVALHVSSSKHYHVFSPGQMEECADLLNGADLLVGFNNIEFDTPAFEGTTKFEIKTPQFDILQACWKALGAKCKGYRLGEIAERTIHVGKAGSGESAPKLFKAGRLAELYSYNINDVYLTRMVFNHIVKHGHIIGVGGEPIHIELPEGVVYA